MEKLKYKEYICSYGCIYVYEDNTIEFVPSIYDDNGEFIDMDFENSEMCDLLDEGELDSVEDENKLVDD